MTKHGYFVDKVRAGQTRDPEQSDQNSSATHVEKEPPEQDSLDHEIKPAVPAANPGSGWAW